MFLRTSGKLLLVVALAALAGVVPARSQSAERSARSFASLINVDALIDNYLRFVARKYNLTEEQDQYTEQLVRARVDEFLERHYDELADLVDKLVMVRNGGDVAPEELIEWGRRVQPLYIEAKGIIIQTNDEWRGILTEEQRQMHDEDVRLMWESFATTEDQLSRLTAGQMSVEEFRNPRMARQGRSQATQVQPIAGVTTSTERAGSALRQAKAAAAADQGVSQKRAAAKGAGGGPAAGRSSAAVPDRGSKRTPGKRSAAGATSADEWEQYVQQFIQRYALTEEQASRANKILKSCQSQRDRLMRNRAEQLERLNRQEEALRTSSDNPNKAKEQAEITAQRAKLMAPIDSIFDKQLKPRLEKIPTRAQREAAEKAPAAGRTAPGKPASVVPGKSAAPRVGKPGAPPTLPKKPVPPAPPPDSEGSPDNPEEEEDYEEEGENK